MTANNAIDIVLQRVRDPHATAHARAFVLSQLSDCQRLINLRIGAVTAERDFTIAPFHQLYADLFSIDPLIGRVLSVRDITRTEIPPCDWLQLSHAVPGWMRSIGNRLLHWAYVGRDMLLFHPGLRHETTVTLTYAVLTPDIGSEMDTLIIPDTYVPQVLDLCELHLLAKQRSSDDIWKATAAQAVLGTGQ